MIDIHSHILPGIDDGSKSLDISIKMLKIAETEGTEIIVATPHYIRNVYENLYEDIWKLYENLKQEAEKFGLKIKILLGQEIMLDTFSLELCREKKLKGINGTKYMLVEFPLRELPKNAMELIYELRIMGICPIIAHPERYKYIYENVSNINNFIDEGCFFQVNTGSLNGLFGKHVENCAKTLVKHGIVSFIGSDAHDLNKRCPGLIEGYEKIEKISEGMGDIIKGNLRAMINNETLNNDFEKISRKKFWGN